MTTTSAGTPGPYYAKLQDVYDLIQELVDGQADEHLLLVAYDALRGIDMRRANFVGHEERRKRVARAREAVLKACELFPAPKYER